MSVGGIVTGTMGLLGDYPHSSPPSPNRVGKDYLGLVKGVTAGAPDIFNLEKTYGPQYQDLALQNLGRSVPSFTNIMNGAAPDASALFKSINPGTSGLMDTLMQHAQAQLDSGAQLDPELQRLFEQMNRKGAASRGMGFGPSDVFNESLGLTKFGNDLRTQRQGFAEDVAKMGTEEQTLPTLNLLQNIVGGAGQLNANSGPTLFPSNQSYDLFNTAYNARAASNIANQNTQTAMLSGFNSVD
jgi:hypothetical protein